MRHRWPADANWKLNQRSRSAKTACYLKKMHAEILPTSKTTCSLNAINVVVRLLSHLTNILKSFSNPCNRSPSYSSKLAQAPQSERGRSFPQKTREQFYNNSCPKSQINRNTRGWVLRRSSSWSIIRMFWGSGAKWGGSSLDAILYLFWVLWNIGRLNSTLMVIVILGSGWKGRKRGREKAHILKRRLIRYMKGTS